MDYLCAVAVGRVMMEPALRDTAGHTPCTYFLLSVSRQNKRTGVTNYTPIFVSGRGVLGAEMLHKIHAGDTILVVGSISVNTTVKNGEVKTSISMTAIKWLPDVRKKLVDQMIEEAENDKRPGTIVLNDTEGSGIKGNDELLF